MDLISGKRLRLTFLFVTLLVAIISFQGTPCLGWSIPCKYSYARCSYQYKPLRRKSTAQLYASKNPFSAMIRQKLKVQEIPKAKIETSNKRNPESQLPTELMKEGRPNSYNGTIALLRELLQDPEESQEETNPLQGKSVGIDLGTTFSLVGIVENGIPKVLPVDGSTLVPSAVAFFEDGSIVVGKEAKNLKILRPSNIFTSVKRVIGKSLSEVMKNGDDLKYLNIKADDSNSLDLDCKLAFRNQVISPITVSALILRKLKVTAEKYFNETVTRAVVTIPAHFTHQQQVATEEAAKKAGFQKVQLLREPEAAAIAFGLARGLGEHLDFKSMDSKKPVDSKVVLVCDLGGGTFDVSILEIGGGLIEVISSGGDPHLGGDDFNAEIVKWLQEQATKSINGAKRMKAISKRLPQTKNYSNRRNNGKNLNRNEMDRLTSYLNIVNSENPDVVVQFLHGVMCTKEYLNQCYQISEQIKTNLSNALEYNVSCTELFNFDFGAQMNAKFMKTFVTRSSSAKPTHDQLQIVSNLLETLPPLRFSRSMFESRVDPLLRRLFKPVREAAIIAGVSLRGDSGAVDLLAGASKKREIRHSNQSDDKYLQALQSSIMKSGNASFDANTEASYCTNAEEMEKKKSLQAREVKRVQKSVQNNNLKLFPGGRSLDSLVLVGGAMATPCVRRGLCSLVGKECSRTTIDTDSITFEQEAVALGAAIHSHFLDRETDNCPIQDENAMKIPDMKIISDWKLSVLRSFCDENGNIRSDLESTLDNKLDSDDENDIQYIESLQEKKKEKIDSSNEATDVESRV